METVAVSEKKKHIVRRVEYKRKPVYDAIKRAFDICAAVLAFLLVFVFYIIIAVAIKLDSPGKVIYKQERLAKDGHSFTVYKFRTMREDAEKDGAKWADENDERITRVGKFLRASRLDELPQLINIIKGDMSIVGPRPERPVFYEKFSEYIDGFDQRLMVKQGLTGLAQVNGGYSLKPEEKIVYDLEYIEKRSLWLDLKIIFKTVAVVFNHKGAR